MLVTNKINLFSFLFGKRNATNKATVTSLSKAQALEESNLNDLDGRIGITKSEDFYKVNNVFVNSPFNQLNK